MTPEERLEANLRGLRDEPGASFDVGDVVRRGARRQRRQRVGSAAVAIAAVALIAGSMAVVTSHDSKLEVTQHASDGRAGGIDRTDPDAVAAAVIESAQDRDCDGWVPLQLSAYDPEGTLNLRDEVEYCRENPRTYFAQFGLALCPRCEVRLSAKENTGGGEYTFRYRYDLRKGYEQGVVFVLTPIRSVTEAGGNAIEVYVVTSSGTGEVYVGRRK